MKPKIKIKVVGVGGAGCNAISRMAKSKIFGVDLIAINTDLQDLKKTRAHFKIRIGKNLTKGLGAGMKPEIGEKAALEQREEIKEILKGADMVFITAGLGGGSGTGASPIVAEISKSLGVLTLGIFTLPFSFEGNQRSEIAQKGLKRLREKVDSLISISNDKLLSILSPNTPLSKAFFFCDQILRQGIEAISDLILAPGIINVDFANLREIMENSGTAFFGIGKGIGEKRVEEAIFQALNSPLTGISFKGAKGILFNVSGGKDLSLSEIDEIAKIITKEASLEAKIAFGAIEDKELKKGEIKLTVIATGF